MSCQTFPFPAEIEPGVLGLFVSTLTMNKCPFYGLFSVMFSKLVQISGRPSSVPTDYSLNALYEDNVVVDEVCLGMSHSAVDFVVHAKESTLNIK